MYLPRSLRGIAENSRQSGSLVHLPVKTGSLTTRNSINLLNLVNVPIGMATAILVHLLTD